MASQTQEALIEEYHDENEEEYEEEEEEEEEQASKTTTPLMEESELTDDQRRKLRKQQRGLQKEMADRDDLHLKEARGRNNELFENVRFTREAVLDGENLIVIANQAAKQVDRLIQVRHVMLCGGMTNLGMTTGTPSLTLSSLYSLMSGPSLRCRSSRFQIGAKVPVVDSVVHLF